VHQPVLGGPSWPQKKYEAATVRGRQEPPPFGLGEQGDVEKQAVQTFPARGGSREGAVALGVFAKTSSPPLKNITHSSTCRVPAQNGHGSPFRVKKPVQNPSTHPSTIENCSRASNDPRTSGGLISAMYKGDSMLCYHSARRPVKCFERYVERTVEAIP